VAGPCTAAFGHYIGGAWVAAGDEAFDTQQPGQRQGRWRGSRRLARRRSTPRWRPPRARAQAGWWALGGHGRARWLYALARQIQRNARLFAVVESLDNGKPIRESRDIDIPLVARHFYHHAGWAQLMDSELAG
jgi:aldehyde dehydrogenase (NAD+)